MRAGIFSRTVAIALTIFFAFPTLIVVATSFTSGSTVVFPIQGFSLKWYLQILQSDKWVDAIGRSFTVAILAAAIALVLGTLLALAASRARAIASALPTGLSVLPMIVPTVISGLGFYIIAVKLGLTGTPMGFALAHASIALPFVFINVLAALTSIDSSVEEAARVSGSTEIGTVLRITVPLILPSAIVGAVLAFVVSWDEVIVALMLADPEFKTVPVLIYGEIQSGARPTTSAVSSLMTLISIVVLVLVTLIPAGIRQVKTMRSRSRSQKRQEP